MTEINLFGAQNLLFLLSSPRARQSDTTIAMVIWTDWKPWKSLPRRLILNQPVVSLRVAPGGIRPLNVCPLRWQKLISLLPPMAGGMAKWLRLVRPRHVGRQGLRSAVGRVRKSLPQQGPTRLKGEQPLSQQPLGRSMSLRRYWPILSVCRSSCVVHTRCPLR